MSCTKVHVPLPVRLFKTGSKADLPVLTVVPWEAGGMSPEAIGEVLK